MITPELSNGRAGTVRLPTAEKFRQDFECILKQKLLCITAGQRSGTTALREQLWRTGRFYDFAEVFDPSIIELPHSYFGFCANQGIGIADIISISDADRLCSSFINHLTDLASGANLLIDIKFNSWNEVRAPWTYTHQEPHFLTYLKTIKAGFIFVRRRDVIQQILSERLADKTQVWHNILDNNNPPVQIDIPHARLLTEYFLKSESDIFEFLRNYSYSMFMDYEELFSHGNILKKEYKNMLCVYAGEHLPFSDVGDYRKNALNKSIAISNYHELYNTLQSVVDIYRHPDLKEKTLSPFREGR